MAKPDTKSLPPANMVDRLVTYFSPRAGVLRRQARVVLGYYEAGESTRMRNFYRNRGTQNVHVQKSAAAIRTQARHLVLNHDISRGALRVMVNNVVGPNGIGIEPQPRKANGEIHEEYAQALSAAHRDWSKKPEVTHRMNWSQVQRAAVRGWRRDGEIFSQMIVGQRPDLDHGTQVPFSLEMFEAEMVPIELNDASQKLFQGIELNGWGRPRALYVMKTDPWRISIPTIADTKRIPWELVVHLANLDNVGQVRGVSEFASIITRLEDIKDYEESERVAAKIAAMLTAYVRKGNPESYDPNQVAPEDRQINFQPGMVIDDLLPGEEIDLVDSKRPNPNLITFRQGQLRAVAAGWGASYSSVSRDYNGTYSAQRQELVEQWVNYACLTDDFVCDFIQPIWQMFVRTADLSRVVPMPKDVVPETAGDCFYVAQSMPWIDPLKEALGWEALVKAGFASEIEVIRRRGGNPMEMLEQIEKFRNECDKKGLVFSSNEAAMEAAKMAVLSGQQG
jgi:lambda family phage portal protein